MLFLFGTYNEKCGESLCEKEVIFSFCQSSNLLVILVMSVFLVKSFLLVMSEMLCSENAICPMIKD